MQFRTLALAVILCTHPGHQRGVQDFALMADVDALLRLYGLARYSVPGDGDCFLYSVTVVCWLGSCFHRRMTARVRGQLRFEVEGHRAASRGCLLMPA